MKLNLNTLFMIFIIVTTLTPLAKKKWCAFMRWWKMMRFARRRGSRVICLIHRQETVGLLGIPVFRYIDVADSEDVIRAIHTADADAPLDLVLHTPGGLVLAAYQIANAVRMHRGKTTVFVPHYAMSGGTLIALAADEIVMEEHALLGPVDPQIGEYPAVSLVKLAEEKPISDIDDKSWILADIGRKSIAQVREQVVSLLANHSKYALDKVNELSVALTEGRWTHDYPITYDVAKGLGLPVSNDMPHELYDLMRYYPQPIKRQSTVEYFPAPVRPPGKR